MCLLRTSKTSIIGARLGSVVGALTSAQKKINTRRLSLTHSLRDVENVKSQKPALESRKKTEISADSTQLLFWSLVGVSLLLGFNVVSHLKDTIGDEGVHSFQIRWFVDGTYQIFKYVTMLPVYHALNAMIVKVLGGTDINYLRFANMLLSLSVIPAFLALAKTFNAQQAYSRTLQFIFIPFLFPLFFLVYTDLLSLALALAMVERTLNKKYIWAAIFAFGAVFVRQPNILWVGYCGLIILLEDEKIEFSQGFLIAYLKKTWPFIIVIAAFGAFVVWNGGVAVGDAEQHQVSYNPSNFYFFLLVSFALYLPYSLARYKDVTNLLMANKWVFAVLIIMFFYYMATYEHPHKYNTKALSFYRHNLFIYYSCDVYWLRILSYFAMAWMALTYIAAARVSRHRVPLILLLPVTLLAIIPMPLIEHRYYFVSLTLFLAMRPPIPEKFTGFIMVYYVVVGAYILYNLSRMIFFL